MSETLNVYQRVAALRDAAAALQKTKKAYGYNYVPEDEILAKITPTMKKLGLLLIPHIVPGTLRVEPYTYQKTKILKDGTPLVENVNEILCTADLEYEWINLDDPTDRMAVPWAMSAAQSDASFSFGGALTYSKRTFLLKTLDIATVDDDPDNYRAKQKAAEQEEQREVTEALVESIGTLIASYLETNPDNRDAVITIIKKYVKHNGKSSGDYTKVADPQTASKLLKELKQSLGVETEDEDTQTPTIVEVEKE